MVDRLSSVEWIPIGREMIESNGEGRTLYDIKNPNHIISLIKTE